MSSCPNFINEGQGLLRTQKDKQVITRLVHEIQALYDKPRHTNATEKAITHRFVQIANRLIKSGRPEFKKFKTDDEKRQLAEAFISDHPDQWVYQGPVAQQKPNAKQALKKAIVPKRVQLAQQAVAQAKQQLQQAQLQLKRAQSS